MDSCLRQAQLVGYWYPTCLTQTQTVRHYKQYCKSRVQQNHTRLSICPFLTSWMATPQDLLIPSIPKKTDQIPSKNSGSAKGEIIDPKMFTINQKYFITNRCSLSQKCPNNGSTRHDLVKYLHLVCKRVPKVQTGKHLNNKQM